MITLKDARNVIAAAEKKAAEIGQPQNIAVVDAGGNLVCIWTFEFGAYLVLRDMTLIR